MILAEGNRVEISFLSKEGEPAACGGGRGRRIGRVAKQVEDLLILIDSSIVEIFVNQGEMVFTTRIYLEKNEREISFWQWENASLETVKG